MTPSAIVSTHPLVLHKLTQLRDHTTPPPLFRALVRDLTQMLIVEALADAALRPCVVRTPMAECVGAQLTERVGLVPILRAGLGMVDPILSLMPEASVWHLGLYRDHQTLQPVTYYNKLPDALPIDLALVLDPMLATGGSAIAALDCLKARRPTRIKLIALIAAPEGVRAVTAAHPDVPIHVGVIDERLDETGYIVPGLGDAGDRLFGTM